MKRLKHLAAQLVLPCLLVCTALTSGCFSRQLVRFGTHAQKPVVLLETVDTHNYLVWTDHEHVFWSCAEANSELRCTRRCGSGTDLQCPEFAVFQDAVGTNVR
jgi:hypothetical protein